jgi:hypothetical protein
VNTTEIWHLVNPAGGWVHPIAAPPGGVRLRRGSGTRTPRRAGSSEQSVSGHKKRRSAFARPSGAVREANTPLPLRRGAAERHPQSVYHPTAVFWPSKRSRQTWDRLIILLSRPRTPLSPLPHGHKKRLARVRERARREKEVRPWATADFRPQSTAPLYPAHTVDCSTSAPPQPHRPR